MSYRSYNTNVGNFSHSQPVEDMFSDQSNVSQHVGAEYDFSNRNASLNNPSNSSFSNRNIGHQVHERQQSSVYSGSNSGNFLTRPSESEFVHGDQNVKNKLLAMALSEKAKLGLLSDSVTAVQASAALAALQGYGSEVHNSPTQFTNTSFSSSSRKRAADFFVNSVSDANSVVPPRSSEEWYQRNENLQHVGLDTDKSFTSSKPILKRAEYENCLISGADEDVSNLPTSVPHFENIDDEDNFLYGENISVPEKFDRNVSTHCISKSKNVSIGEEWSDDDDVISIHSNTEKGSKYFSNFISNSEQQFFENCHASRSHFSSDLFAAEDSSSNHSLTIDLKLDPDSWKNSTQSRRQISESFNIPLKHETIGLDNRSRHAKNHQEKKKDAKKVLPSEYELLRYTGYKDGDDDDVLEIQVKPKFSPSKSVTSKHEDNASKVEEKHDSSFASTKKPSISFKPMKLISKNLRSNKDSSVKKQQMLDIFDSSEDDSVLQDRLKQQANKGDTSTALRLVPHPLQKINSNVVQTTLKSENTKAAEERLKNKILSMTEKNIMQTKKYSSVSDVGIPLMLNAKGKNDALSKTVNEAQSNNKKNDSKKVFEKMLIQVSKNNADKILPAKRTVVVGESSEVPIQEKSSRKVIVSKSSERKNRSPSPDYHMKYHRIVKSSLKSDKIPQRYKECSDHHSDRRSSKYHDRNYHSSSRERSRSPRRYDRSPDSRYSRRSRDSRLRHHSRDRYKEGSRHSYDYSPKRHSRERSSSNPSSRSPRRHSRRSHSIDRSRRHYSRVSSRETSADKSPVFSSESSPHRPSFDNSQLEKSSRDVSHKNLTEEPGAKRLKETQSSPLSKEPILLQEKIKKQEYSTSVPDVSEKTNENLNSVSEMKPLAEKKKEPTASIADFFDSIEKTRNFSTVSQCAELPTPSEFSDAHMQSSYVNSQEEPLSVPTSMFPSSDLPMQMYNMPVAYDMSCIQQPYSYMNNNYDPAYHMPPTSVPQYSPYNYQPMQHYYPYYDNCPVPSVNQLTPNPPPPPVHQVTPPPPPQEIKNPYKLEKVVKKPLARTCSLKEVPVSSSEKKDSVRNESSKNVLENVMDKSIHAKDEKIAAVREYMKCSKNIENLRKQLPIIEDKINILRRDAGERMRKMQRTKEGHNSNVLSKYSELEDKAYAQLNEVVAQIKVQKEKRAKLKERINLRINENKNSEELVKEDKVKKKDASPKPSSSTVYSCFDTGDHWCLPCKENHTSILKMLDHLHSEKHKQNIDKSKVPWSENLEPTDTANKKTQIQPAKGVEFVVPADGYFCELCKVCLPDKFLMEQHLKGHDHCVNYLKYKKTHPRYESNLGLVIRNTCAAVRERKRKLDEKMEQEIETKRSRSKDEKERTKKSTEITDKKLNESPNKSETASDKQNSKGIKLTLVNDKKNIKKPEIKKLENSTEKKPKPAVVYIGRAPNYKPRLFPKGGKNQDEKLKNVDLKEQGTTENLKKDSDDSENNTSANASSEMQTNAANEPAISNSASAIGKPQSSLCTDFFYIDPTPVLQKPPLLSQPLGYEPIEFEKQTSVLSTNKNKVSTSSLNQPVAEVTQEAFMSAIKSSDNSLEIKNDSDKNNILNVSQNAVVEISKMPDNFNSVSKESEIKHSDHVKSQDNDDASLSLSNSVPKSCIQKTSETSHLSDSSNHTDGNTFLSEVKLPDSLAAASIEKQLLVKADLKSVEEINNDQKYLKRSTGGQQFVHGPLTEEEEDFLLLGIDKSDMTPLAMPKPPPHALIQTYLTDENNTALPEKESTVSAVDNKVQTVNTFIQSTSSIVCCVPVTGITESNPVCSYAVNKLPPFPPPLQVPPPPIHLLPRSPVLLSTPSINVLALSEKNVSPNIEATVRSEQLYDEPMYDMQISVIKPSPLVKDIQFKSDLSRKKRVLQNIPLRSDAANSSQIVVNLSDMCQNIIQQSTLPLNKVEKFNIPNTHFSCDTEVNRSSEMSFSVLDNEVALTLDLILLQIGNQLEMEIKEDTEVSINSKSANSEVDISNFTGSRNSNTCVEGPKHLSKEPYLSCTDEVSNFMLEKSEIESDVQLKPDICVHDSSYENICEEKSFLSSKVCDQSIDNTVKETDNNFKIEICDSIYDTVSMETDFIDNNVKNVVLEMCENVYKELEVNDSEIAVVEHSNKTERLQNFSDVNPKTQNVSESKVYDARSKISGCVHKIESPENSLMHSNFEITAMCSNDKINETVSAESSSSNATTLDISETSDEHKILHVEEQITGIVVNDEIKNYPDNVSSLSSFEASEITTTTAVVAAEYKTLNTEECVVHTTGNDLNQNMSDMNLGVLEPSEVTAAEHEALHPEDFITSTAESNELRSKSSNSSAVETSEITAAEHKTLHTEEYVTCVQSAEYENSEVIKSETLKASKSETDGEKKSRCANKNEIFEALNLSDLKSMVPSAYNESADSEIYETVSTNSTSGGILNSSSVSKASKVNTVECEASHVEDLSACAADNKLNENTNSESSISAFESEFHNSNAGLTNQFNLTEELKSDVMNEKSCLVEPNYKSAVEKEAGYFSEIKMTTESENNEIDSDDANINLKLVELAEFENCKIDRNETSNSNCIPKQVNVTADEAATCELGVISNAVEYEDTKSINITEKSVDNESIDTSEKFVSETQRAHDADSFLKLDNDTVKVNDDKLTNVSGNIHVLNNAEEESSEVKPDELICDTVVVAPTLFDLPDGVRTSHTENVENLYPPQNEKFHLVTTTDTESYDPNILLTESSANEMLEDESVLHGLISDLISDIVSCTETENTYSSAPSDSNIVLNEGKKYEITSEKAEETETFDVGLIKGESDNDPSICSYSNTELETACESNDSLLSNSSSSSDLKATNKKLMVVLDKADVKNYYAKNKVTGKRNKIGKRRRKRRSATPATSLIEFLNKKNQDTLVEAVSTEDKTDISESKDLSEKNEASKEKNEVSNEENEDSKEKNDASGMHGDLSGQVLAENSGKKPNSGSETDEYVSEES